MKITDTGQDGNRDDRVPPVTEPQEAECAHLYIEVCALCELRDVFRLREQGMRSGVALAMLMWRFPDAGSRRVAAGLKRILAADPDDVIGAAASVESLDD